MAASLPPLHDQPPPAKVIIDTDPVRHTPFLSLLFLDRGEYYHSYFFHWRERERAMALNDLTKDFSVLCKGSCHSKCFLMESFFGDVITGNKQWDGTTTTTPGIA